MNSFVMGALSPISTAVLVTRLREYTKEYPLQLD